MRMDLKQLPPPTGSPGRRGPHARLPRMSRGAMFRVLVLVAVGAAGPALARGDIRDARKDFLRARGAVTEGRVHRFQQGVER